MSNGQRKTHRPTAGKKVRRNEVSPSGDASQGDAAPSSSAPDDSQEIVAPAPPVPLPEEIEEEQSDEDRKGTIEIYKTALESFDRTLVAVSSGALALSITFLHDIAPTPTQSSAKWLLAGWAGLLASLAAIIVSMPVGHKSIELDLARKPANFYRKLTTGLNLVSVAALLVGFAFLGWFAHLNMFAPKPAPEAPKTTVCQCVTQLAPAPSVSGAKKIP